MPKYVFKGQGLFRYEQPNGEAGHAIKDIPFESKKELTDSCVRLVVEEKEKEEEKPKMSTPKEDDDDDLVGINVANFLVKIANCTQIQTLDEYMAYENGLESPRTTVLNAIASKRTKLEAV